MKRIIFIFAVLTVINSQAQQYHPLVSAGKLWSTGFVVSVPSFPKFTEYLKFEGDTVAGGTSYMKIFTSQDTVLYGWSHRGYIREDGSHRVYQYHPLQGFEFLLYDFSAEIGDTIIVNQSVHLVLDSITTAILETGEPRTRFVWKNIEFGPMWIQWENWIEGVGSYLGVLQTGSQAFVGGYSYLLCMHENDTLIYIKEGNYGCDILSNTIEQKEIPEFQIRQISPDGQFMVEFSQNPVNSITIEVANMLGNVVYSHPATPPENGSIDLSVLPRGFYILLIRSNNSCIAKKFLKR